MSSARFYRARELRIHLLAALLGVMHAGNLFAADALPEPPPAIRRLFVPEDMPRRWPAGDWRPWRLSDFEQRLTALQPSPPQPDRAIISRATYWAVLGNGDLRGGRFELHVKRTGATAAVLPLENWNLPLTSLSWKEGKTAALSGTDPQGRTLLIVDRPEGTLVGTWTLAGRKLAQGQEFSLQFPPASATRLELQLPADRTLHCPQGEVTGPGAASEPGWSLWQLELGGRSQAQILVNIRPAHAPAQGATAAAPLPRPLVIARREMICAVRQEVMRLQADFHLEVLEVPVRELRLLPSQDLKVIGVTLGDNTPLTWTEVSSPEGRQLRVVLSDPLEGPGIVLRVQALATPMIQKNWTLPQVRLADAVPIDGQVTVNVAPPLELDDFQFPIDGYRQTALVSSPTDGETIVLRQLQPRGDARMLLAWPRWKARCRMLTQVQATGREWTATTQFEWSAASGSTFSVRCTLPPEWTIIDVREPENEPTGGGISWELLRPPSGRDSTILRVEFREALSPEHPRQVRVICRTAAASTRKSVAIPLYIPQGAQDAPLSDAESYVSVSTDATATAILESGDQVKVVTPAEFPTDPPAELFWRTTPAGAYPGTLLLKTRSAGTGGRFFLQSVRDLADVRASVRASVVRQRIIETFRLRMTPRNAPLKRVLVYLSESATEAESMDWTLETETPQRLSAERLDPTSHAIWNVPETGSLWEVRLPAPLESDFTLSGKRTRALKSPDRISLAFVPHASQFEGRVEIEHHPRLLLQLEPRNLDPLAETSENLAGRTTAGVIQRSTWRYRDLSAAIDCRIARDREGTAQLVIADMHATVRPALEKDGSDLYWTSFRISGSSDNATPIGPFRWTLPADAVLLQVTREGARIIPEQSGAQYLVFPSDRRRSQTIQLQYRIPTSAGFGPNHRRLAFPETHHTILRFNLQLQLPDTIRLDGGLSNIRFSEPAEPRGTWRQTLFGRWGRPAGFGPFSPLTLGGWSDGWPLLSGTVDESAEMDSLPEDIHELSSTLDGGMSSVAGAPPSGIIPGVSRTRVWRTWRYTAPIPPQAIQLVLWNRAEHWQLCWILMLLTLLVGVVWRARQVTLAPIATGNSSQSRWVTATVGLTVFLLVCVPGIAVELAATLCLALLIVSLLPQSWLDWRPEPVPAALRIPGGSTRSFAQPTALVGLVALTFIASGALADEGCLLPAAANQFDVLVPVDSQGKPAGKEALVYVSPALHERLLQQPTHPRSLPDSLLVSAEYEGVIAPQQPFTVLARYQVVVLARQPEVRVPFAFRGGNLGGEAACLVDGKPYPVLSNARGNGCIVLLSGVSDHPAKPVVGAESKSAEELTERRYTVEFRFHPHIVTRGNKGDLYTAEMGVPPVLSSLGTLTSVKSYPWQSVQETGALVTTQLLPEKSGGRIRTALGRAASLTWEWSELPRPPAAPPELQWQVSTVADVDPGLVQLRCQVQGKVVQGMLSAVRWPLPPGTAVRSVQAADLLEHHLEHLADGGKVLWITFNRPRTSDFSIQTLLVHPAKSQDGMLVVPSLPLPECGDAPGSACRVLLNQLAVRPPADFRMEPQLTQPARARTRTIEEFQREQPLDGSRRAMAWLLDGPQTILLKFEVYRPRLDVSSSTIYRILNDRITVTWEAEIATSSAPGFRYRLQLDPRLQVSSISVMEEGVERLLRWNPAPGNQALVFLNDRTTRGQKLILESHLPLAGPGKVELPQLNLVYADVRQNRISVYHDAGWNVRLANADRFHTLPPEPAEQFPYGREIPLGRFELPTGNGPGAILIEKNIPGLNVDRLFLLNTQDKLWKLSARLRLEVASGRGSEFEMIIPRENAPASEFHSEPPGRHVSTLLPDGSQQILISPEEMIRAGASCTVTLKLPVLLRNGANWTLPEIRVPGSRAGTSFVLTSSRGATVKISGQRFERLEPTSLPPPVRTLVPEPPTGSEWLWSAAGTAPVRLEYLGTASTSGRIRRVILAETQLIPTPSGLHGRQLFWLPPASAESLEFYWPPELEVIAALVDGNLVSPAHPQTERLSIPLRLGSGGQTVMLAWKGPGVPGSVPEREFGLSQFWGQSGEFAISLPRPINSILETELLEVLPSEKLRLRPDDSQSASSAGTVALDRWEALLRWQAAQLSDTVSDELLDATDQFIQRMAIDTERLLRHDSNPATESMATRRHLEDLKNRTREFLAETGSLEFQRPTLVQPASLDVPPLFTVCWSSRGVPQGTCRMILSPPETVMREQSTASNTLVQVHFASGGLFPWLLGIASFSLCVWLTTALRRAKFFVAIQSRTWLSCALLGIIWWQVLLASGWGFVLLVGGLLHGLVGVFRRSVLSTPS